jgi:hypothetical protein
MMIGLKILILYCSSAVSLIKPSDLVLTLPILGQYIIGTDVLTKFHEHWDINVAFPVYTR